MATSKLISRLDKVYHFTRGCRVGLRNIGPETANKSRTISDPSKLRGSSQITIPVDGTAIKFSNGTFLALRLASEPLRAVPCQFAHTRQFVLHSACTVGLHISKYSATCLLSDKLPAIINCNC